MDSLIYRSESSLEVRSDSSHSVSSIFGSCRGKYEHVALGAIVTGTFLTWNIFLKNEIIPKYGIIF